MCTWTVGGLGDRVKFGGRTACRIGANVHRTSFSMVSRSLHLKKVDCKYLPIYIISIEFIVETGP